MTVASNDRDTVSMFAEAGITIVHAWNITPIDDTVTIRSIPVIGRNLHFPLDVNLTPLHSAAEYPCLTESSRTFISSILQILIEDR